MTALFIIIGFLLFLLFVAIAVASRLKKREDKNKRRSWTDGDYP